MKVADIEARLKTLESRVEMLTSTASPQWQDPIWYETNVQIALRQLLLPGDTVFDVGANIGVISAAMDALVAPHGRVVSFEASPRTLSELYRNLNQSNAFRVSVIHAAVSDVSGELLPFFYGAGSPADSLSGSGAPSAYVPSVTLDDYVKKTGLHPAVVKMDIEGAEAVALRGFTNTLQVARPPLILEMRSDDFSLTEWLRARGYDVALDLAGLVSFEPASHPVQLKNVLFLNKDNDRGRHLVSVARRSLNPIEPQFEAAAHGRETQLGVVDPGLYLLELEVSEEMLRDKSIIEFSIKDILSTRVLHIAEAGHIAQSYLLNLFDVSAPGPIKLVIGRSVNASKYVRRVSLTKLLVPAA